MRKVCLWVAAALLLALLSGCGASASDVMEQYEAYAPVEKAANRAGISIGELDTFGSMYSINVFPSNAALNQSSENAGVLANRLRVANAEKPDEEVAHKLASINSVTTKADGTSTQMFFPAVNISKDEKTKFVLIYFEGISKEEAPGLETPPLFFILELDKKGPKLLTETPLLADGLFD